MEKSVFDVFAMIRVVEWLWSSNLATTMASTATAIDHSATVAFTVHKGNVVVLGSCHGHSLLFGSYYQGLSLLGYKLQWVLIL